VRVGGTTQRYHILTFLLHTSYYFTLQGRQNVSERAHIASFIWRWPIVNGDRQDVSCSWDLPSLNRISYHYLDDVEFVPVTGVVFTLNIPAPEVSMARRSGCIRQLYLWHITRVRIFFSDASFSLFACSHSYFRRNNTDTTTRGPGQNSHKSIPPAVDRPTRSRQAGFSRCVQRGTPLLSFFRPPSNPTRSEGAYCSRWHPFPFHPHLSHTWRSLRFAAHSISCGWVAAWLAGWLT
jgi:hypothetical protein